MTDMLDPGEIKALAKRGITEATCRLFGYSVAQKGTKICQVAPYYNSEGTLVGQKLRFADKTFTFLGDAKAAEGLWGQHLWRDGGKKVVITEGEIDAMSVSQLQGNKWPVVSLKNGAQGYAKSLAQSLEWLLKFEEVVMMFDMDEPGRAAARGAAAMLPPGKAKIASLPMKDPNEMLMAGKGKELIDAVWSAKEYRPDGLVTMDDIFDEVLEAPTMGMPWCFPTLTQATYGRRYGEVYAIGAGTGVGKTDFLTQQIAFDIREHKVGLFVLEQQPAETAKRIAGKIAGKRFHVPGGDWTQEELVSTAEAMKHDGNLFFYDHFGCAEWDTIESTLRYLHANNGVRIFYLDHLTALAAESDDERKALEKIMAKIGSIVKELDIMLIIVSHLATPDGKPHEEGGRVMIRHFKGSRAIGFWCHFMFGMERDQQAEDEATRQTTTFRILKDRNTGDSTGTTIKLGYDSDKGQMFEAPPEAGDFDDDGDVLF